MTTKIGKYAGIDQGTTTSRILVVDEKGRYCIAHVCAHRQITPHKGWVEHDPEELIRNLKECIDKAGPVDALGIDNQGESVCVWDKTTGEAVYNVIVWQDSRTQDEIEDLKAKGLEPRVQELCGLPLDPYFSASKIAWIIRNVPKAQELLRKGRLMVGTTDTFFMYRLTGVYATDYNTASRTSLLNLKTLQWDEELCQIFGVPYDILPPIKESIGDFGAVTNQDGFKIPLTASLVDQFACIYGHGCRKAGDAKITFGTGAFMESLTGDEIKRNDKGMLPVLCWKFPGEKPMFGLDGGIYNAASALNWAKSLGLFNSFEEINSFDRSPAVLRDIMFVPALSGLGCPFWDRNATAMWTGMRLNTTRQDLIQALIEGVVLRTYNVLEAMHAVCPVDKRISIDGGMVKNPYLVQFLADIAEREVVLNPCAEVSAFGSAELARRGLGIDGDIEVEGEQRIILPRPIDRDAILERFNKAIKMVIMQ